MAKKYRIENRHEVDGYILFIGKVEPITDRFQLRRLIVNMDSEGYKQEVPFDFVNEKMRMADGFALGEHVHITFTLRGRSKLIEDKFNPMEGKRVWYPSNEILSISKL